MSRELAFRGFEVGSVLRGCLASCLFSDFVGVRLGWGGCWRESGG